MKYLKGAGPFYAEDVGKEFEGKTLIGTCGDCKHWHEAEGKSPSFGRCSDREEDWYKEDGCISWEEKKND